MGCTFHLEEKFWTARTQSYPEQLIKTIHQEGSELLHLNLKTVSFMLLNGEVFEDKIATIQKVEGKK